MILSAMAPSTNNGPDILGAGCHKGWGTPSFGMLLNMQSFRAPILVSNPGQGTSQGARAVRSSMKTPPLGHRLCRDRIVRFEVTLQLLKVRRVEMLVECRLAGEFLVKHELPGILRIKVKFVNETSGLLARGSNERVQLPSELLLVTWSSLKLYVEDDRSFTHLFP
jgi:hypothetical protein